MNNLEEKRLIARMALDAFGGKPAVFEYWDNNHKSSIDVLTCNNRPDTGITSYSTIGLLNYSIGYISGNKELRIELVGACYTECEIFANILSSCAFNIINSKYLCKPGVVFENIIKYYIPNTDMKHILFTSPFLWDDRLKTIEFTEKKVTWLLLIPISEKEYNYGIKEGFQKLENVFERKQIDIYNINRKSVL